jgi:hypothetical protein
MARDYTTPQPSDGRGYLGYSAAGRSALEYDFLRLICTSDPQEDLAPVHPEENRPKDRQHDKSV